MRRLYILNFIFFTFVSLFSVSYAQPFNKPANPDTCEKTEISASLDNLLTLWYRMKLSDTTKYYENKYSFAPDYIPTYPDSVYAQRLNSLNSPIPLVYNENVRNFIDLYLVSKRKNVAVMLGLAHYYFPIFEAELDKNHMPIELRCLPIIESALNTYAVSRVGATGIWQFMYQTGKIYGLNINSYVDERRDPVVATKAAIAYLKDMYSIYHDWLLVIASYNCGAGNVNRAIRRSGNSTNFWQIYPYLPMETRGYVPAFIAANYVMNFYREHNLYPSQVYMPGLIDTLYTNRNINFDVLSGILNIPVEKIRMYNPQYTRDVWPKSMPGTKYILRLPIKDIVSIDQNRTIIHAKQDTIDQEAAKHYAYYNTYKQPAGNPYTCLYYRVKPGDNLGLIAGLYNSEVNNIKRWNNLRGNTLPNGRWLKIFVPTSDAGLYKNINTLTYEQKVNYIQNKGKVNEQVANNSENTSKQNTENNKNPNTDTVKTTPGNQVQNTTAQQPLVNPAAYEKTVFYTIKSGDTLWSISQKFPGNTANDLMRLNNISGSHIQPGQKIKVKVSR